MSVVIKNVLRLLAFFEQEAPPRHCVHAEALLIALAWTLPERHCAP